MAIKTEAAPPEGRRLLSWSEAAAYLGPSFTERWLKRQVYDLGTIPARRIGRRVLIEQQALDDYVDSAPMKPTKQRRAQARQARAQRAKH